MKNDISEGSMRKEKIYRDAGEKGWSTFKKFKSGIVVRLYTGEYVGTYY